MFENRLLRRIFGHKRDEVTRDWKKKKLHNEKLNDLYCSPSNSRVMKLRKQAAYVARVGERRRAY